MRSIRLILADDNPEVLETLAEMLQPPYCVVAAVGDGGSVLREVEALTPDVIILDISLPDLTGFEVVRQLRKRGSNAKIIFLTVHENIDFVRAAFDLKVSGYVFKTRISSDLIEAINTICDGGHFSSAELSLPS